MSAGLARAIVADGANCRRRGVSSARPHEEEPVAVTVELDDCAEPGGKAAARVALYRYNVERIGIDDRRPIGAVVRDAATGAVLGGLWGRSELGLLFLDMFFLPDSLRGRAIGSRLLSLVEGEATRRGCRHAVVETSTFQAPAF